MDIQQFEINCFLGGYGYREYDRTSKCLYLLVLIGFHLDLDGHVRFSRFVIVHFPSYGVVQGNVGTFKRKYFFPDTNR